MEQLVSVISVVFNDVDSIEATISSVLGQSYKKLEYLVIDGASSDGTMDVVRKYEERISKVVSEPDKGVYDAMNKGVRLAQGAYVLFMNSGDVFADAQTVEKVFGKVQGNPDMIYGNHDVVYTRFVKHKKALPIDTLWKHMAFSHQSLFAKRDLLLQHPFDLSYKVSADFHFIYNRYREGCSFQYINQKIAIYQSGGHSELQVMQGYRENREIVLEHDRRLKVRWFHFQLMAKQYAVVGLRWALPAAWFEKLMALKNRK